MKQFDLDRSKIREEILKVFEVPEAKLGAIEPFDEKKYQEALKKER